MVSEWLTFTDFALSKTQLKLVWPLCLALWMGWKDIRTNRIPNYLTYGGALAGLGYQAWLNGWPGLADGLLGLGLGFGLLIFFYWKGGLGAGDVKALAALGAWLGPQQTFYLFFYMAISGLPLIVIVLWKRGLLWSKIRQLWEFLLNRLLLRSYPKMPPSTPTPAPDPAPPAGGIPYAVAMAMGMVILCGRALLR
jgi:prepilin peptidase CpaA